MFENSKYVTAGIVDEVSMELQLLMWTFIDTMDTGEKDYLQVFELSTVKVLDKVCQKLIHTQEQPCYKKEYLLSAIEPIDTKIFVIDDITHSTMLLANEY